MVAAQEAGSPTPHPTPEPSPRPGPAPAILIRDLRVDYGAFTAVHHLDLSLPPGEIYGLVGPNGAGKTTTIRVLATLLQPTLGEAWIHGHSILDARREVHRRIGYMPDLAPVAPDLKVWEFLDYFAAAHGIPPHLRRARAEACLERVKLTDRRDAWCGELSRGLTQRLVLAKTLLHQPSVLLLDEPASGMDPMARINLRRVLRELAAEGSTILISSHILTELADMCTSVGIMNRGRLRFSGPVSEVVSHVQSERQEVEFAWASSFAPAGFDFQFLLQDPRVSSFSLHDHHALFHFSGPVDDLSGLLQSLIHQGLPVTRFVPRRAGIEDLLLQMDDMESER